MAYANSPLGRYTSLILSSCVSYRLKVSSSLTSLLRIKITAEVDDVRREYTITFGRYGDDNEARGFAYARADAPGGREEDAERFAAVVEALTGKRPRIRRMKKRRDNDRVRQRAPRRLRPLRRTRRRHREVARRDEPVSPLYRSA